LDLQLKDSFTLVVVKNTRIGHGKGMARDLCHRKLLGDEDLAHAVA
jgi:hypothetical protein